MLDNGGWNAIYMENHDQSRTISRYCSDAPEYRTISAKLIASHLACQSGTLFVYQGQEWAQKNMPRDWDLSHYKDIEVINHWNTILRDHPDDKELQEKTKKQYWLIGRDNARTPIQWNADDRYAGWTTSDPAKKPWMDIHPDYVQWNAEAAVADPNSAFHYWKKLLALRKSEVDTLIYGKFVMLDIDDENVCAYARISESGKRLLVIGNWQEKSVEWTVPKEYVDLLTAKNILPEFKNYEQETQLKQSENGLVITLKPYEALVALG